MTGKMPDEGINPAPYPDTLHELWCAFKVLHAGRVGEMGLSPIKESEIRAYCLNRGVRFSGWELDAIRALDGASQE